MALCMADLQIDLLQSLYPNDKGVAFGYFFSKTKKKLEESTPLQKDRPDNSIHITKL
jgi:hypothetical protein